MAHQHGTHGRPQVIQGNFQGGQPTFVAQARPAIPETGQRPQAPHVQAALQQHAPPGQTAQQHQGPQPPAAQLNRIGNAFQVPPTVNLSHPGQGRPLPEAVRQKMESVFNTDFSDVRVHVGAQAQSIGAVAFTMGSQIHFAPGQYNPNTSHGQRLLGHELTHVMQQRAGRVRNPFGRGVAVVQDPGMEAEAERMGIQAAAHRALVQAKREQPGMAAVQQKPAQTPGGRPLVPHVQAAVVQPSTTQAQARPLTTAGKPEVIQGRFPGGLAQIVRFHQQAGTIQPKTTGSAVQLSSALAPLPPVGEGQALPVLVQRKMEKLFGTTFAEVRIHEAPEARSLGAQAFTRGSHIYFAPGQYNPTTTQGRQLLAYELTHVVQQRNGRVKHPFGSGVAVVHDPVLEAEAQRFGLQASRSNVMGPHQAGSTSAATRLTESPTSIVQRRAIPSRGDVIQADEWSKAKLKEDKAFLKKLLNTPDREKRRKMIWEDLQMRDVGLPKEYWGGVKKFKYEGGKYGWSVKHPQNLEKSKKASTLLWGDKGIPGPRTEEDLKAIKALEWNADPEGIKRLYYARSGMVHESIGLWAQKKFNAREYKNPIKGLLGMVRGSMHDVSLLWELISIEVTGVAQLDTKARKSFLTNRINTAHSKKARKWLLEKLDFIQKVYDGNEPNGDVYWMMSVNRHTTFDKWTWPELAIFFTVRIMDKKIFRNHVHTRSLIRAVPSPFYFYKEFGEWAKPKKAKKKGK